MPKLTNNYILDIIVLKPIYIDFLGLRANYTNLEYLFPSNRELYKGLLG
jgi:hypothetical protein